MSNESESNKTKLLSKLSSLVATKDEKRALIITLAAVFVLVWVATFFIVHQHNYAIFLPILFDNIDFYFWRNFALSGFVATFNSLFMVLLVFIRRNHITNIDANPKKPAPQKIRTLHMLGAAMLPNIFLFINYNHNFFLAPLDFEHALIWAAIFVVMAVFLFLFIFWFSKSSEFTLISSALFWIAFWFYGDIVSLIRNFWPTSPDLFNFSVFFAPILVLSGVFSIFIRRFAKASSIFNIVSLVFCGFFLFNIFPAVRNDIEFRQAGAQVAALQTTETSKDYAPRFGLYFVIDESLPKPDIYWLWMDGMISLSTFEYFYNVSLDDVREQLSSHGFLIYENATTRSPTTRAAVTTLFSPAMYDNFFSDVLDGLENYLNSTAVTSVSRTEAVQQRMSALGVDLTEITHNNELVNALLQSGYNTVYIGAPIPHVSIGYLSRFYNTTGNHPVLLSYNSEEQSSLYRVRFGAVGDIINTATPMALFPGPAPQGYYRLPWVSGLPYYFAPQTQRMYRALIDSRSEQSPKFTFMLFDHAHPSGWWWLHEYFGTTEMQVHERHPAAYAYALVAMLNTIDLILTENPDAVIILQSDHGIHDPYAQRAMYEAGYTVDELIELFNSVFSAVRIPEQYGGLDEPLSPTNIARVLVNRFVGENYEFLS